jgi:hypothetical protein
MDNALNPADNLPAGGGAPVEPQGTPPPAPSTYKDLQTKKGFKTEEDLAKSYVEAEQTLGRKQAAIDKVKQQLESQGYTLNDDGTISQVQGGFQQQPQYPQQPQETVYDPYTGQAITDPIALQLAKLPVGQREAVVFNAMLEQREKQQRDSYQAEAEVLSKPEAKGFEDDVKKVMMQLPVAQRADKKNWEDALLRVKGMQYDQMAKNMGQEAVHQFLNKENIQNIPGTGAGSGGVSTTDEEESAWKYYQERNPGLFKDKAHFLKRMRTNTA